MLFYSFQSRIPCWWILHVKAHRSKRVFSKCLRKHFAQSTRRLISCHLGRTMFDYHLFSTSTDMDTFVIVTLKCFIEGKERKRKWICMTGSGDVSITEKTIIKKKGTLQSEIRIIWRILKEIVNKSWGWTELQCIIHIRSGYIPDYFPNRVSQYTIS